MEKQIGVLSGIIDESQLTIYLYTLFLHFTKNINSLVAQLADET